MARRLGGRGVEGRIRGVARALLCTALLLGVPSAAPVSFAQDDSAAFRDLATGSDFRVRVAAALALGKSRSPGARPALEKALGDPHPAVRAAAAAALGALGDPRSVPALRAAIAAEAVASVKATLDRTLQRLSVPAAGSGPQTPGAPAQGKPKFLVALGKVENRSGVTEATLAPTLKTTTRSRMAQVPGVEVLAEGTDPSAEGKSRNLPAFTVDASLTQLAKKQGADGVGYAARVEYLIRKMPNQALKGTMAGTAQALADVGQVRGQGELAELQLEAVSAAVDSALKGASPALEAATR